MVKKTVPDAPSINIISASTTVKGDITSTGDFRIDGSLIGSLSTKGKIIIGTTGKVDGEITCQNADISGEVKANLVVAELMSLKATAKVTGDVHTGKLAIEAGASFSGTCNMEDSSARKEKFVLDNEKLKFKEKAV
jgi:cytoskeletal protein CcmA (bactofilin family)